jgi:hypothetical protein
LQPATDATGLMERTPRFDENRGVSLRSFGWLSV